ncbi:MAG: phage terminase small subunit P27 family [Alphaproteobacteria bacterium]|nr:phage terminase small subunit P27 family [Alphaproteobacteria bacterium]
MKGRKPKLKVIEGGAEPGRCPGPPTWLSIHAKREWKRCAPELHRRHLLIAEALATLESYCTAAGQVREFEEMMSAEGRMVTTDDGPKPHPAFKMQQAAMREARLLAAELALTPHRQGTKGNTEEAKGDGWDSDLLA